MTHDLVLSHVFPDADPNKHVIPSDDNMVQSAQKSPKDIILKQNQNADAWSERPWPFSKKSCVCHEFSQLELKENSVHVSTQTEFATEKLATIRKNKDSEIWDPALMLKAQQEDPDIGPILRLKSENQERPKWEEISSGSPSMKFYWAQWNCLELRSKLLYRKWVSDDGRKCKWQLLLPHGFRDNVLKQLHDARTAGHMGYKRTYARMHDRYFWYKMKTDVQRWVKTCNICQAKHNPPGRKPKAFLQKYQVGAPLERIALDITGPLPKTQKKNKYILVVSDYFTKWTEAYALPNIEAETVATVLVEQWISRYGTCREIHSDQGSNFESKLFKEMCSLLGIEKTRTTPFHPQGDGQVERFNATLKTILSKIIAVHNDDWDVHLPYAMMAYRSSVHDSTGETPNMLMFGRETELPIDIVTDPTPDKYFSKDTCQSHVQYAIELEARLWEAHQRVRDATKQAFSHQKRQYDRWAGQKSYKKHDLVWLHSPKKLQGKTPKLQCPWQGPYVITKVISDVVFRIQKSLNSKPKVVHHNRLKPFYTRGSIDTSWVDKLVDIEPLETPVENDVAIGKSSAVAQEVKTDRPKRKVKPPKRFGDFDRSG